MFGILKDKYLRIVFAAVLALFLVAAFSAAVKFGPISDPIIIHYDAYRGFDYVGDRFDILAMAVSVLVMLSLNFVLADLVYARERFFSYVISFASLAMAVIFLIAMVAIISVN